MGGCANSDTGIEDNIATPHAHTHTHMHTHTRIAKLQASKEADRQAGREVLCACTLTKQHLQTGQRTGDFEAGGMPAGAGIGPRPQGAPQSVAAEQ